MDHAFFASLPVEVQQLLNFLDLHDVGKADESQVMDLLRAVRRNPASASAYDEHFQSLVSRRPSRRELLQDLAVRLNSAGQW